VVRQLDYSITIESRKFATRETFISIKNGKTPPTAQIFHYLTEFNQLTEFQQFHTQLLTEISNLPSLAVVTLIAVGNPRLECRASPLISVNSIPQKIHRNAEQFKN